MPLKMTMQERKRFVGRARWEYAHARRRKDKSALIDIVVQFVGYTSRKQAIRIRDREKKSKEGRKRGRSRKLTLLGTAEMPDVMSSMGQPWGKRMQFALSEWLEKPGKTEGYWHR